MEQLLDRQKIQRSKYSLLWSEWFGMLTIYTSIWPNKSELKAIEIRFYKCVFSIVDIYIYKSSETKQILRFEVL